MRREDSPVPGHTFIRRESTIQHPESKSIWSRPVSVKDLNDFGQGTMAAHLDIVFTESGPDYLKASMPVDHRTRQPFGLMNGGASVVLAETVGSTAAHWCVDADRYYCVGLEVNANHIRAATQGRVVGTGRPVHLGRRTQVWEIRIEDEEGRLISLSRLTLAVLER